MRGDKMDKWYTVFTKPLCSDGEYKILAQVYGSEETNMVVNA